MNEPSTSSVPSPNIKTAKPLFDGAEWTFDVLKAIYDAVEEIGVGEMDLDIYPNQIEVITAEQMLDAYTSTGMPLMYRHWSFGKQFAFEETNYKRGMRSLAYELVINSNPCINYVMEENSATMQTLVFAHAAFGHNHFFKNNYLFKQWTNADAILDYLSFAKDYVSKCEERYGLDEVEQVLDSAHAIMRQGISRHPKRGRMKAKDRKKRQQERKEYEQKSYSDLWRTLPTSPVEHTEDDALDVKSIEEGKALGLPEENLLYFLEKYSPSLEDWQRELLRIVRVISQYFYPQRQTKMMNEGCATFVHYQIMNRLYGKGLLNEGTMMEFLHMHSSVIMQPNFNDRRFSGINPYALGFAMMQDIERIADTPTKEDEEWFPAIAGQGNALDILKSTWADFRDESFILQYLSPKVMRDFRLFRLHDNTNEPIVEVKNIHDERGYREVRHGLAAQYDVSRLDPDLKITDADLSGTRRLALIHKVRNGVLLSKKHCELTLQHIAQLWGYRVKLSEVDEETGKSLRELEALPLP
ncbi:MAG: SpoVR family protein [Pseudomonadota bacterium]